MKIRHFYPKQSIPEKAKQLLVIRKVRRSWGRVGGGACLIYIFMNINSFHCHFNEEKGATVCLCHFTRFLDVMSDTLNNGSWFNIKLKWCSRRSFWVQASVVITRVYLRRRDLCTQSIWLAVKWMRICIQKLCRKSSKMANFAHFHAQ